MSNTRKATAAKAEAKATAPADDPRDAQIAEMQAELAKAREAAAQRDEPAAPVDARDATIAELRAQLDEIRSTPEGAHAELLKSFAALQDQVTAMQAGTGKVPTPVNENPDPYLYGGVLATGEVIYAQHPHGTHHESPNHGVTVPVLSYFALDVDTSKRVTAELNA